jgi:Secretion system C-terminal sorting domain
MKTKPALPVLCVAAAVFLFSQPSAAQSLYPVPTDEKISNSELIIEGRVTEQSSFWNAKHTMIYTSNTVEIYKVFKGSVSESAVEILTVGGSVGNDNITASDLLKLSTGETGVFFCYSNQINLRSPASNKLLYDVWSSAQGCYKYDLAGQTANAPFTRFASISHDLYNELQTRTGKTFENRKPSFRVENFGKVLSRGEAVSITSFSPASVVAGGLSNPAENVLTITGSGFGTATGSAGINFDDPDDGTGGTPFFIAAASGYITSWSNTQIVVKVPTNVGTGTFSVVDAGGLSGNSPSALDVKYAILTATFGDVPANKMFTLGNVNGSGGYNYVYSTSALGGGADFSAAAQEPAFSRAITTWKEIAGLNFTNAGTTTSQTVNPANATNIIMLDNTNTGNAPLPSGVLAICYSSATACGGSSNAQRLGFDIVIRNTGVSVGTTNFNNGPCRTSTSIVEIDMESVILHELGHALNLGHINDGYKGVSLPNIDPGKLMNFSIVNGVDRRTPDWSAFTGAQYCINPKGFTYPCLGTGEMTPLTATTESKDECPVTFPSAATLQNTSVSFDLVHATSNKNKDPQFTAVKTSGTGTAITNNAYYAIKTSPSPGNLDIIVSGYTTSPAAQATCTGAGVELSLYQVSSCPVGQSFPAPVAYLNFNASGALPSITGLSANTTYLMMLDGLSNTKASFTFIINGSVLPINLLSFTAEKNGAASLLKWQTGSEFNNDYFDIETSKDGINFYKIGSLTSQGNATTTQSYNFTDNLPVKGINFYRLKQVDKDGRQTYSKTVSLDFEDVNRSLTAYPNPARDKLTIDLARPSENVILNILSLDGKVVKNESWGSVQRSRTINVSELGAGTYVLKITAGNDTYFIKFIKE